MPPWRARRRMTSYFRSRASRTRRPRWTPFATFPAIGRYGSMSRGRTRGAPSAALCLVAGWREATPPHCRQRRRGERRAAGGFERHRRDGRAGQGLLIPGLLLLNSLEDFTVFNLSNPLVPKSVSRPARDVRGSCGVKTVLMPAPKGASSRHALHHGARQHLLTRFALIRGRLLLENS